MHKYPTKPGRSIKPTSKTTKSKTTLKKTTKKTIRAHSTSTSGQTPSLTYNGTIHLTMGPMFSGKTTHLLAAYREAVQHGHPSLLIKHSSDTRYHGKTEVVSHTNSREMAVSVHLLADPQLLPLILDKTHIFIDEGQFFPDLDVMADQFANMGKTVQIAALDGTFQRDAFPVVANIIPRVEKLTKLVAKCHTCQSDAPFSKRISQDTEVHVIGGQDKYQAACREHFFTNAI